MIDQVFVAVVAFLLFVYFLNSNKHLPPGPLRLPVLGSIIQLYLANPKFPHLAFSKISEKYGDIFSFGFGSKLAAVVSSYEGMHEIFKLNETNHSRYKMPFVEDRNYGKNLGIIFGTGQSWTEMRQFTKKAMREYGYGKVKMMHSLIESANELVDVIKTGLLDSNDSTLTVKTSTFSVHVLNIVWAMFGGYKFDPNDERLKRNMKCVDKAVQIYGNQNSYNAFPFMKTWFPKLVNYPEHLKIHEEIHGFSKFLINDAVEKRSERLETDPTSVIETFLDKIEEQCGKPDTAFTQEQLEIIVEDLILGSLETTGNLLNWAILFMVLNPDIQNKVRQVIFEKEAKKDLLTALELKRIPYFKATILEIFRMGDVAPNPGTRLATDDIKVRDYIIPKGTILFYNLHSIYNDKNYWKDPETFRPERFLNENGEIDNSKSERILNTVFGVGARVCFGENIGLDSFYTYLAALIANFKFESIPGQEPSAENFHFALTVCPDEYKVKVTQLSR
ncbi:farnesoate epoxidase-like [Bradysia coprophila]|uniref:farnesoate epoxidase-like n=1 Tax=Bradysia coprophila TaxID=38358 RepID=UPI00187D8A40|nr:farnesoate epoxidase-like [Bradysia coprophila]